MNKGACPAGRAHDCPVCGGPHRGLDHHSRAEVLAVLGLSDKGKGKGKKGAGKGKNKKGEQGKDAEKKY